MHVSTDPPVVEQDNHDRADLVLHKGADHRVTRPELAGRAEVLHPFAELVENR